MEDYYRSLEEAEYYAEQEEEQLAYDGKYIKFLGMDCNNHSKRKICNGWSGNSIKCQCMNHHVHWQYIEHDEGWEYYADVDDQAEESLYV